MLKSPVQLQWFHVEVLLTIGLSEADLSVNLCVHITFKMHFLQKESYLILMKQIFYTKNDRKDHS